MLVFVRFYLFILLVFYCIFFCSIGFYFCRENVEFLWLECFSISNIEFFFSPELSAYIGTYVDKRCFIYKMELILNVLLFNSIQKIYNTINHPPSFYFWHKPFKSINELLFLHDTLFGREIYDIISIAPICDLQIPSCLTLMATIRSVVLGADNIFRSFRRRLNSLFVRQTKALFLPTSTPQTLFCCLFLIRILCIFLLSYFISASYVRPLFPFVSTRFHLWNTGLFFELSALFPRHSRKIVFFVALQILFHQVVATALRRRFVLGVKATLLFIQFIFQYCILFESVEFRWNHELCCRCR